MGSYGRGYAGGSRPSAPPYNQGQQQEQGWRPQRQPGYGGQAYAEPTAGPYGSQPAPGSYAGYAYSQQPAQSWNQASYSPQPQASYQQAQYGTMFPPGMDPEIIRVFQQADTDGSGTIDSSELGRLLAYSHCTFSPRTLRLMLHLFADNRNDTSRIGPLGFAKLWREIMQWDTKFKQFDKDGSQTIDVSELQMALLSFNFAIPPPVLQMLVSKYDLSGASRSIGYDNFIECGFIVKGLTEKFRDQDRALNGTATFDYTSFMLMVIPYIAA